MNFVRKITEVPSFSHSIDLDLPFRAIFEASAIGMTICSLDGCILESNPAVSRMLGYTREELAGMHPRELHPNDFDQDEALIAELLSSTRDSFELDKRYHRKDGTYFWGHVHVSAVRGSSQHPLFLIATLEDTTARRHVEKQLREAEKMEVIGRLAGGVAHDFNNLLTGIILYCDLISAGLPPENSLRPYVDEVRMAGEQGAALTQQLLTLARRQAPHPTPTLLNDIVASTENLIRRLVGEHIELATILASDLGPVLADPTELRQVLLNLVLNARDAMPNGGCVTVSTASATFPGTSSPAVVLSVRDCGCGMDPAIRAHIFDPFFTTKEPGRGTGLGLATVRRIIEGASGSIDVQSELGSGTCIQVFFPVIAEPVLASPAPTAARSGETILLVDDHAGARRSLHRILFDAGYRVLQAPGARRALEIFSEHSQDVDMLVADCIMPAAEGIDVAQQLRRQKPALKVLLISGYRQVPDGPPSCPFPLIHKPFSKDQIIQQIRTVLDSSGEFPC